MAARLFLGIHEGAVHDDLEHAATRRDEDQIFDLVFELF
jgi:hypothetical protein